MPMSIAVSAVINRSGWLSGLLIGVCASLFFIAGLIVADRVGNLNILARVVIAIICCSVAVFVFFRTIMCRDMHWIQISGTGQIRLSVLQNGDDSGAEFGADEQGELVDLLPVSTLWSGLLILHLRHANRRVSVITVLPDSLSANSYRALLVACRWIVMRHVNDGPSHGN